MESPRPRRRAGAGASSCGQVRERRSPRLRRGGAEGCGWFGQSSVGGGRRFIDGERTGAHHLPVTPFGTDQPVSGVGQQIAL